MFAFPILESFLVFRSVTKAPVNTLTHTHTHSHTPTPTSEHVTPGRWRVTDLKLRASVQLELSGIRTSP
ncbi:hypothetical protein FKM82_017808 [Ascaphus truei]